MNNNMQKIMEMSWRKWHHDIDADDVPAVNLCYEKGFIACHNILMPLLVEAALHVMASHGAEHMLDGFRPQHRKIDDLVDKIKEVLPK